MKKELYKIKVTNKVGDLGTVHSSTLRSLDVAPTMGSTEFGFNPGEMIAFSWSTCLEATLRYVKQLKGLNIASFTEVTFKMMIDESNLKGYEFIYHADIFMDTVDIALIQACVDETHKRCPVSKLLIHDNTTIKGHSIKK